MSVCISELYFRPFPVSKREARKAARSGKAAGESCKPSSIPGSGSTEFHRTTAAIGLELPRLIKVKDGAENTPIRRRI
jgi:hypothetical protein